MLGSGAAAPGGDDDGAPMLDPSNETEFDEDNVPAGVDADKISHEDYLNGPGEKVTNKFDVAGTYGYYCEPHQGSGMQCKIIVN